MLFQALYHSLSICHLSLFFSLTLTRSPLHSLLLSLDLLFTRSHSHPLSSSLASLFFLISHLYTLSLLVDSPIIAWFMHCAYISDTQVTVLLLGLPLDVCVSLSHSTSSFFISILPIISLIYLILL